jgi:hypothetical protein
MESDGESGLEQNLGATVRWPFCLITPVSILEGETESINLDGAFISCKGSPPLDGTFSLVIEIPNRPPLKATVELAWTTLLAAEESISTLGVYLEFVSLSDADQQFLKDFIAAHRHEGRELAADAEETEATDRGDAKTVTPDEPAPPQAPTATSGVYETVPVKVMTRLHMTDVARTLGMDYDALKDLNPHIRGHYLPIGQYALNVPFGLGFKIPALLQQLSRSVSRGGEKVDSEYIVQTGDTLKNIARKTGVTVNKLKKLNALDGNVVRVGQRLRVRSTKQY